MPTHDLTIEILKSIRDEVVKTNVRLDLTREDLGGLRRELSGRIDGLREELGGRIDGLREELSKRIVESEVRTSTAITDLACTVREMTGVLRATSDLRPRVERCERDIADLQRRVG